MYFRLSYVNFVSNQTAAASKRVTFDPRMQASSSRSRLEDEAMEPGDYVGKQVIVGICAMEKKTLSKPMKEILTRLEEFEHITTDIFPESVILNEPVDKWPLCDCLIAFHSSGFPLDKSIQYANLRNKN